MISRSWLLRRVLDAGLAYFAIGLIVLNMPDSEIKGHMGPLFGPAFAFFGINEGWAMFTNPRDANLTLEAIVHYADGYSRHVRISPAPRGTTLQAIETLRLREAISEMLEDRDAWPDAAQFVARRLDTRKSPPVRVDLLVDIAPLPDPWDGAGKPLPTSFKRYRLGSYPISRKEL